jgi:putative transposase
MAHTFSQLYAHIVFAVKERRSLISPRFEEPLYKYIAGIVRNRNQKLLAINGMPDHLHLDLGLMPSVAISDIVRDIKSCSSHFIRENGWCRDFQWQRGYGAFSHSHRSRDRVISYIRRQKEHHARRSFQQEFELMLDRYGVEYDRRHLFEFVEGLQMR